MNPQHGFDLSAALDGADGSFQPTVQLKLVDADGLLYSWRWQHNLGPTGTVLLGRELVQGTLDELSLALPTPLPGETTSQALRRSLSQGPLTDPQREMALSAKLAHALFPFPLAMQLNALLERGMRPHIRIQPSPSTGQVPWEALYVDAGERVIDNVDLSVLPPATVRNAPERRISPWDPAGKVVGVLDPRIPGFGDTSELGSVLGPIVPDSPLTQLVSQLGPRLVPGVDDAAVSAFRRRDVTRDRVEDLLTDAARFIYVGHVTTAGHGLDARMHLSCGADTTGRAGLIGAHRPLTAADLVLGHRPDTLRPWRMPNRVALIACESGGDVMFAEPTGLVAAAIHGGAQYVTSTRWTLPTDKGLRHFARGATDDTAALADVVIAVNDAHEAADPVAALNTWQRWQSRRWSETGDPRFSPVTWAAFSTTMG